MKESDIQHAGLLAAKRRGAYVIRVNSGVMTVADRVHGDRKVFLGKQGTLDSVLCYLGRFVAIEFKQPTGRVTPAQAGVINEVWASGGVAAVCRSVSDVHAVLDMVEAGTATREAVEAAMHANLVLLKKGELSCC